MAKSTSRPRARANATLSSAREAPDDPHRLAREYLTMRWRRTGRHRRLAFWRDGWWLWEGRRYREFPESELKAEVTTAVKWTLDRAARRAMLRAQRGARLKPPIKVTRSLIADVLQAIRPMVLVSGDLEQPMWLVSRRLASHTVGVANGLLNLDRVLARKRAALGPYSPLWFSTVCLPYGYEPKAECARWLAFLGEILESDQERMDLLQEWFGYCLTTDTSLQKSLILVGEGANGKSVILQVLTALLGPSNLSHVPLEVFGERFHLTPTLGKLANIVSEVGPMNLVAEGYFKSFVAGDSMFFDRKGLPGITARPTARLILATNCLPPFRDRSGGVWRRLLLLPFRVVLTPERQDHQLLGKLTAELSGIFHWAVEGLRRLRKHQRFTEPSASHELMAEYQVERNPARSFFEECVNQVAAARVPCSTLYAAYRKWCDERGFPPINEQQFGKEIARYFPTVQRVRSPGGRGEHRPYFYVGLELVWTTGSGPVAA
jgi:putative DNA primase/helicase